MKFHAPIIAISLVANLSAADVPKIFGGLFEPNIPIKGQIGVVMPPPEIDKYVAKIESAARKDPKWFREFFSQTKLGEALPYDERLGLTKEEYAEYVVLWNKRDFKVMEDVMLLLRPSAGGTWAITATGNASMISTLRYVGNEDVFRSPNGDLKRINDIKVEPNGILGAWSGHEWKFEEETGLGKTKENIALGRFADHPYGIIVYHVQELSTEGSRLLDKSLVVRFPLGKAGSIKAIKVVPTKVIPTTSTPAKAAASKSTKPAAKH